jgi:ABC-2 type transport system permease protein
MRSDVRHALLIATREYLENVRTRGFWLSLLLLPIILAVLSIVPIMLADSASTSDYAVLDHSGWLDAELQKQVLHEDLTLIVTTLADLLSDQRPLPEPLADLAGLVADEDGRTALVDQATEQITRYRAGAAMPPNAGTPAEQLAIWWYDDENEALALNDGISVARYRRIDVPGADRAHLDSLVADEQLLGYFVIPDDPVAATEGAHYVTRTLTNLDLQRWYGRHATQLIRGRRILEENIAPELARWIEAPIRFQALRLTDTGTAEAQISDTLAQWAPVAFVYMLWISIFSVTQMLLTNTVEEKSNKLVEVLLSSVSALELMAGKILGIAATGLTIVTTWLLMVIAAASVVPTPADMAIDLVDLVTNPVYLGSFLLYFVLGYLLYAAILCSLGSLANNLKEAQNLMIPVQLCLFVPLLVVIPIGRDPSGLLAQITTWIPPLTPFVMMNRAAFPPGLATYVATTLLMLVSIYLALRAAARIFETGILMTGKPPRIKQLLRLVMGRK